MARKREDKARQESSSNTRKSRTSPNSPSQDKNYVSIKHQLSAMGLTLREIPGDGNCLFGALADQLDGTFKTHQKHRQAVVSYMRNHREDFEPFVEDDIPFERHLSNLAELGTYGGNECIVAFARLQKVKVVIHQLNTPLWQIDGTEEKENVRELHISYHNGDHYNSVRRLGDYSSFPPKIKLTVQESSTESSGKKGSSKDHHKAEAFPYYYNGYTASYEEGHEDDGNHIGNAEELTELEAAVMENTGCKDIEDIRMFLEASRFDVHEATGELNCVLRQRKGETPQTANGIWSPGGTATRILGLDSPEEDSADSRLAPSSTSVEALQAKLKSNTHLSNSKRKELKKQLRKQQANDRKRQQYKDKMVSNEASPWESSEEAPEAIIVKDLGCLSI